jgi:hypothetical protein
MNTRYFATWKSLELKVNSLRSQVIYIESTDFQCRDWFMLNPKSDQQSVCDLHSLYDGQTIKLW